MKQLAKTFLICLVFLLSSGMLLAQEQEALLITSETLDKQAKSTLSKAYLTENKVLIESGDEKNPTTMLYDADKEELYLIDHKQKEYYVMNKAQMEALNEQMKAAMEQMEQQLKQLPEEQRKMIEEQIRKVQGIQEPLTYQQVASGVAVKNWKSSRFEGKSGDRLKHEVYMVSYKELGEDKADFKALLSMYQFMQDQLQQMSNSMPGLAAFTLQNMPGAEEGLTVKSILYDEKGNPESTTSLHSIEETSLADEKWQVPPQYKQKIFSAGNK